MFCSLCHRKLELPVKRKTNKDDNKSNGKNKANTKVEVEVIPKKKKKRAKKDPTAGLCLTGKPEVEDEINPMTTSNISKLMQSQKPRDKNKLRSILEKKPEKKIDRLDAFFKLL